MDPVGVGCCVAEVRCADWVRVADVPRRGRELLDLVRRDYSITEYTLEERHTGAAFPAVRNPIYKTCTSCMEKSFLLVSMRIL